MPENENPNAAATEVATLTEVTPPVHPLMSSLIRPIKNWFEWLEIWHSTRIFQILESLLHVGFDVPLDSTAYRQKEYDAIDRISFYLSVADGWADSWGFQLPNEGSDQRYFLGYDAEGQRITESPAGLRRRLSRKAFNMLCANLFRLELRQPHSRNDDFKQEWKDVITAERLFPAIQHFFRVEKEARGGNIFPNFFRSSETRGHQEQQVVNFLINLSKFLWGWREPGISCYLGSGEEREARRLQYVAMRDRIDAAKPWMVDVLSKLHKLDELKGQMVELDDACIERLKEIALNNNLSTADYRVREDRKVATLDEACYIDSPAAWFLKERELRLKEYQRLAGIRKAQDTIAEAQAAIETLGREG